MHHALTIRVVALTVLILSVGVGATSYIGAQGKTEDASARNHVSMAVHATMAWYQDPFGGQGSYRTLRTAELVRESPRVSSDIRVTVLAHGRAYCLADVEHQGHSAYYLGGDTGGLTHLAGAVPYQVTLLHSTTTDAATLCASIH